MAWGLNTPWIGKQSIVGHYAHTQILCNWPTGNFLGNPEETWKCKTQQTKDAGTVRQQHYPLNHHTTPIQLQCSINSNGGMKQGGTRKWWMRLIRMCKNVNAHNCLQNILLWSAEIYKWWQKLGARELCLGAIVSFTHFCRKYNHVSELLCVVFPKQQCW